MGREIKRVATNFEWPMNQVWPGFINPHYKKCPQDGITCWGGSNAAAVYLEHLTNMFSVVADSAASGRSHPYLNALPYGSAHPDWSKQPDEVRRRAVEFYTNLIGETERSPFGFTGSAFKLYFKLLELAGIRTNPDGTDTEKGYEWGECPVCKGKGLDPAVSAAYNAWQSEEPPTGDWWQVWETVSEGSPVTPAFATAEELIEYLVTFGDDWDQKRGDGGWSQEAAEAFVSREGWAPSLIIQGGASYSPRDGMPAAR